MTMSRKDRRVLSLGAVIIGLMLLLAKGLPAWRRWDTHARAAAAQSASAKAETVALLSGLRSVVDSTESRQQRILALEGILIDGSSAAEAGATLVYILTGASARAGAVLGSVEVSADTSSRTTFTPISVRAGVTGDLQGLTEILSYLETAPELLSVTELSITQPDAGGLSGPVEELQMNVTVAGLALITPPGSTAAAESAMNLGVRSSNPPAAR